MKSYTYIISLIILIFSSSVYAQNKYQEVVKYEEIDGMVVFPVTINGKQHKFIYDPMSLPAILDEHTDEIGFVKNNTTVDYKWKDSEVISGGSLIKFSVGKTIFVERIGALAIKSEYLKNLGISGIINAYPFVGYVVTIDSKNKTFVISTPYKPSYISLRNKADLTDKLRSSQITIGQNDINVSINLVANKQEITLSANDAEKVGLKATENQTVILPSVTFANNTLTNIEANISMTDSVSSIGSGILSKGVLSLDYVKARLYFQLYEDIDQNALPKTASEEEKAPERIANNEVVILNRISFPDYVFDYKSENEWKYKGDLPAVIDFWAEWCGPCKRISKSLEELASEYAGQIRVFKVNFDEEPEIAKYFKVQSLPTLLYIPMEGDPVVLIGASPKDGIKQNIEKILLKK